MDYHYYFWTYQEAHYACHVANWLFCRPDGLSSVVEEQVQATQSSSLDHLTCMCLISSHSLLISQPFVFQTSLCCQVVIILVLRWYLNRCNKIRDAAAAAATTEEEKEKFGEYGWLEVSDPKTGVMTKVRVEKRFLDMTDHENLNFRYVL
jgi:hypothetical protein